MKVAVLTGGLGSRFAEETVYRPKPMVEIGGKPLLWHIMMHYDHYGFREFVIALGYRGEYVRQHLPRYCPPAGNTDRAWTIDYVDTGKGTLTGGRLKRLTRYLGHGTFMLTWGDGVSDVDLKKLLAFHRSHGKLATVTAVRPPPRFGRLKLRGSRVAEFSEKPAGSEGWINGAFFVLEPGILDYIEGDHTQWEHEPMERLAKDGQLMAYRHQGFWQCMDTFRDKELLEGHWRSGSAPWAVWERKRESPSDRA